jgi:hypothetical protein
MKVGYVCMNEDVWSGDDGFKCNREMFVDDDYESGVESASL